GSEEIADVLTEYAAYLMRIRRLSEAYNLFARLAPLYATFPPRSPKYLRFFTLYLNVATAIGYFPAADTTLKLLHESATGVDILATTVREQLSFQDLYQNARTAAGRMSITDRLKQIVSDHPDFLKQPRNRVIFAYFALLAGDVELADQFNSAIQA